MDDIVERAREGRVGEFVPDAGGRPAPFSVPVAGTVSEGSRGMPRAVRGERGLLTHFCLGIREPGTWTEHARRTMRLFASEILPALRGEAAKRGL